MKLKFYLFGIATIIISLFCLFPIFTSMNSFRFLVVLSSFYILRVSFNKVRISGDIPVFKVFFFLFTAMILSYLISGLGSINFFIHIFILVIFLFVYEYYRIIGIRRIRNVVLIILGFLLTSVVQTSVVLQSNPAYARILTKNQEDIVVTGISGGYGLVYAALLAFFTIIFLIKKSKENSLVFRLVSLVASISIIYLIWRAGFFLALLLLTFGSVIITLGVNRKNIIKSILFITIIIGPILLFQKTISDFVIEETLGTKYEQKVKLVFETEKVTTTDVGQFDERESRYMRDLNLMLEYPILGSWQFKLVGKHSFVLDMLAQFGLIFGTFFIYLVFVIPYRLMKSSKDSAYTQSIVFFGVLLMFLFLNTFAISIIPVIFVIFPYSNYILNSKWAS